jgi:hypothetical protein
MIKFGMGNTLLTFVDKYYKYGGDLDVEDRGLTIGGYESAWLADLVWHTSWTTAGISLTSLYMKASKETMVSWYLKDQ